MDDLLEFGRRILAQQPFSVLLGAELLQFSKEMVELRVPIRDEHRQHNGFAHGGVVSYAADNALTYAGATALGMGVVTSEYKINYVRPAIGDSIIARATVVYGGKSQAVCRCDVFVVKDGREAMCATAQGTITRIGTAGP